MIRRTARQRREYLYRKSLQLQESSTIARRAALRGAVEKGDPLPKDLAQDTQLQKDLKFDESNKAQTAEEEWDMDDEYAHTSGVADPKLVITTSRSPSSRLMQFAKEIKLLFPTSIRLNRGTYVLPDLVSACARESVTDLLLLHEHRGVPTALTISHFPHGPMISFSLHNVVLRHDLPLSQRGSTVSEAYPHLVFEGFTTPLGKRVVKILKHLFPPGAKRDSPRVVSFVLQEGDFISVRHHVYVKTGYKSVEMAEVGPRMEMRCHEIRAGTVGEKVAGDVEWRLTNYTRTAKRKVHLGSGDLEAAGE